MARGKLRAFVQRLKDRIAFNRRTFILYSVLRALVLLTLIRCIMTQRWEGVAISVLVLVLFLVPSILEDKARIEIPGLFQAIIYTFIFAAEILGEIDHYYVLIPGWDTVLHTLNGFLCAAIGFSLVDLLNRSSKDINLSPLYVTIVAFCFSMTIGVLWEFVEFGFDTFLGMDMQKDTVIQSVTSVMLDPTNMNIPVTIGDITSVAVNGQELGFGGYLDIGLYDTMEDLFVNFIGALVFSFIGYFYIKRRGEGKIAKAFIPTITETKQEEGPAEVPATPTTEE